MGSDAKGELQEAVRALDTMVARSEKAQAKFMPGTAQHTLQKNRIAALLIAAALIRIELTGQGAADTYTKEELEEAAAPIASLISKSEKAQQKLLPGTWQHKMLNENIKALRIAVPLLAKARGQGGHPCGFPQA